MRASLPIGLDEGMKTESPGKKSPSKKISTDYMNFGFDVFKLSAKETNAATRLMAKEFTRDAGAIGKRKFRQSILLDAN